MIEILEAGPLTTVQDVGRFGHLREGIPPSGAMDRFALRAANRLVGNTDSAAALECTLMGPRFRAMAAWAVAVTGAAMRVTINDQEAPRWTTLVLREGDVVRLAAARSGLRTYIAFSGGIAVPPAMGSRSTYLRGTLGGFAGRALRAGDRLPVPATPSLPQVRTFPEAHRPDYDAEPHVRAIAGPQNERFTREGRNAFFGGAYTILPQSDRMGVRLQGERISHAGGHDIISDSIAFGSVQVAGDGQPIVLAVDRQSTGGYTKLATVCSFDMDRIAQLKPGRTVRFVSVTVQEAHELLKAARDREEAALTLVSAP